MMPISRHLDRKNLVNKGLIIWLSGKIFMRDSAGSPKQARWLYLACLGSQSHCTVCLTCPLTELAVQQKSVIDQACSVKMAWFQPRSFFANLLTSIKRGQLIQSFWTDAWSITQIYIATFISLKLYILLQNSHCSHLEIGMNVAVH